MSRAVLLLLSLVLLPHGGWAQSATVPLFTLDPIPSPPAAGKYLHFLAGMAAGLEAAGIFEYAYGPQGTGQHPLLFPAVALSASAVAGIAKEILDSTGFGDPRLTDILITMTGGLVAAGAVGYAEYLYPPTRDGWVNGTSFLQLTAALLAIPVIVGFVVEIDRYAERRAAEKAP
jgi:hypothetical protein